MFDETDLIYEYTPQQAVDDGVYVDCREEPWRDVTAQHLGPTLPVYMTQGVYGLIEEAVQQGRQDPKGIWHDILSVALGLGSRPLPENEAVRVPVRIGRRSADLRIRLSGSRSDGYVTVYLPEED